jgi:putative DNA primase/helicase
VTIDEASRDLQLGEKLRGEAPGILNRLLDGLRDWLDNRLVLPEAAVAATAQYREDSVPLGRFLAECVIDSPGKRVQSSVLYAAYVAWAAASAETAWTQTTFSRALGDRGLVKKHSDSNFWCDIELVRSASDFGPLTP